MNRVGAKGAKEERGKGGKGFFGVRSYFRDRPETGFFRDISFGPADSAKNPVSQSRTGARNRVFRALSFGPADSAKNPVSPSRTGVRNRVFSRYFVDLPDSVKNPVSPSRTARNRVFSRYFVWTRRFGQKPGFSESHAQKPGFFEIFRLGPQIRLKTRFLRVARGPETGFFRDISFGPADSAKNPVSQSRSA